MNGTKQKRARSGFPASAAQLDLIEDLARALARYPATSRYGNYANARAWRMTHAQAGRAIARMLVLLDAERARES